MQVTNKILKLLSRRSLNLGKNALSFLSSDMGRRQIEHLGENWSDVHINALHSSTLERAYETALAITKHNKDTDLKVTQKEIYVERKPGQVVSDAIRAGFVERAARLYFGPRSRSGVTPRDYAPPYGGESADDVAERATSGLLLLLHRYGKELDEPPKEFVDKKVINSPNDLPEGIPHIIVVSHNIFLTEFYEAMYNWGRSHRMTTCDYRNVDW